MGVSDNPTRLLGGGVMRVGNGNTLTLNGSINAKGIVDARAKVSVFYKGSNPPPKGKIKLRLVSPSGEFIAMPGNHTLVLAGEPDTIKVTLQNRGTFGKVRFDGMSLRLDLQIARSAVIPLP